LPGPLTITFGTAEELLAYLYEIARSGAGFRGVSRTGSVVSSKRLYPDNVSCFGMSSTSVAAMAIRLFHQFAPSRGEASSRRQALQVLSL
jgi:hypothetical protein